MQIGLVAIGRNEGERLERCLRSAVGRVRHLVYVDSGSTDDSVALARRLGADVVALDVSIPFTAARARNAGFERLRANVPDLELVQFVDGDCELAPGWIERAAAQMTQEPKTAVICGRRRERNPRASVYNHLCDLEWDTPIGRAAACGGDALMRVEALAQVGGFNPEIIAGEEPDLCFRLGRAGWEIWRIDAEMTLHDAAMTRFSQWWRRNVRSGHAYAAALSRYGRKEQPGAFRAVVSNVAWAVPAAWPLWPVLGWRIYQHRRDLAYAAFTVLGKLPHLEGQVKFWVDQARGKRRGIIEYK